MNDISALNLMQAIDRQTLEIKRQTRVIAAAAISTMSIPPIQGKYKQELPEWLHILETAIKNNDE